MFWRPGMCSMAKSYCSRINVHRWILELFCAAVFRNFRGLWSVWSVKCRPRMYLLNLVTPHIMARHSFSIVEYLVSLSNNFLDTNRHGRRQSSWSCSKTAPMPTMLASVWIKNGLFIFGKIKTGLRLIKCWIISTDFWQSAVQFGLSGFPFTMRFGGVQVTYHLLVIIGSELDYT